MHEKIQDYLDRTDTEKVCKCCNCFTDELFEGFCLNCYKEVKYG